MFDPTLRHHRIARAATIDARAEGASDWLADAMAQDTAERLSLVLRDFENVACLFTRTPALAETLRTDPRVGRVTRIEEQGFFRGEADATVATIDALDLTPDSLDAALLPLALHHADDPPAVLSRIAKALRPDGLLLAALPGPRTLMELRAVLLEAEEAETGGAGQRIDPFVSLQTAGSLLSQAGLALPVTDTDILTVHYRSLTQLVGDLRAFAATRQMAARLPPLSRAVFDRVSALYVERHARADGRIPATFEIVSMQGWKPHASQQKPLARGSAEVSLAEALKRD